MAIAVGLAVIVLAGTVLYSQQSGSLAAFGVNIDDLVGVRWNPPTPRPRIILTKTTLLNHICLISK